MHTKIGENWKARTPGYIEQLQLRLFGGPKTFRGCTVWLFTDLN